MASFDEQTAKIERFDLRIEELASQEHYWEKVKKLCCFLGIKTHTVLSLIVETGGGSAVLQKETHMQHFWGWLQENIRVGRIQTGQVFPRRGTDI